MASIVLSSVGKSLGNMVLPGLGGRLLGTVGSRAGGLIDSELGLKESASEETRLENFTVQDSKYGLAIPVIYGRARIAGNVIWASDLIETSHEEGGIGKGGVGGVFAPSSTSYTYSIHCAVALGEGEIGGIQTIWADSKVIYQNGVWKSGVVGSATIYKGSDDQDVDPLLESWIGTGFVPAYRGLAYIVFESLQLSNFGNRLPNLSFEIFPKEATGQPQWLGAHVPSLSVSGYTNRNGGALPITLEGGSVSARTILSCGYVEESSTAKFVVCELDVTGDEPVLLAQTESNSFSVYDIATHTWAIAPDNRFVAIGFQDGASGKPFYVMIYDSQTRTFGDISSFPMAYLEYRQIEWIDAQRFVFTETQGNVRGVRVLMRSGLSVVDLGFYDVWSAGSETSHKPLGYTQFLPFADGLVHIMGNALPIFTTLYAAHLSWVDNDLVLGAPYVLSSGVSLGNGSSAHNFLLRTGENEWTFAHLSFSGMSFMSFEPQDKESVSVTRAWQTLTNDLLIVGAYQAPVVFGDRILVVQKHVYENVYRLSEVALLDDSFLLEVDASLIEDFSDAVTEFSLFYIGANRFMLLGCAFGPLSHLGLVRRRNTGDTLDNVVRDILLRAGYESGDIDVTGLADIPLDGYVISAQKTASSSLSLLQYFEPFDLIESDGQLKAIRRGQSIPTEIACEEAGAVNDGEIKDKSVPVLSITRVQELDLPVELTVDALDASRDYEIGSQRARRLTAKGGPRAAKLSLPLVCTASDIKQIAERTLYRLWSERVFYRFFLSGRWLPLDPSDVVQMEGHKIRITQIALKNCVMQIDGVDAGADDLFSEAMAEGGESYLSSELGIVPSVLHLMDLPLLRNEDNDSGIYVAISGNDGWSGATLWRSPDGVNFTEKASFTQPAIAGTAASVLPEVSTFYKDEASTVQVQLYQGILSSCTENQMLNGANIALLGGEIIQFQSATLLGPGLYELGHLLRGRQGTQEGCGTHRTGEAFVLLNESTVQFLPALLSERNQNFSFRAVSLGGSIATAQNLSLTYGVKSLQPLAPVHLKASRSGGAGSEVTLSWVRRARMNGSWVDYIDVPLDETQELYDLEIMDGEDVVRLFENINQTTQVYTAAQQLADWTSGVPSQFTVNLYQISDLYGRGQKATSIF